MATKTIGTGGDYTTISSWITYLSTTDFGSGVGVLTEAQTGQCLSQSFTENISINNITTTSVNKVILTSHTDSKHDGRANAVSALNNARIKPSSGASPCISVRINHCEISYLEIYDTLGANGINVSSITGSCTVKIHHNIIHNDRQNESSANDMGILIDEAEVDAEIYRNIVYGMSTYGISIQNNNSIKVYNNTCFANRFRGISSPGSGLVEIINNCCFDNPEYNFRQSFGQTYNASGSFTGSGSFGDASGTGSLTGLITTDQFVNSGGSSVETINWSSVDLTLVNNADVVNSGTNLGSPYNTDVSSEPVSPPWDIGADEFVTGLIKPPLKTLSVTTFAPIVNGNQSFDVGLGSLTATGFNPQVVTSIATETFFRVLTNTVKHVAVMDTLGSEVLPTITVQPLHGTATIFDNHVIRYAPQTDFQGDDSVTYTVGTETITLEFSVGDFVSIIGIPDPTFGLTNQPPATPSPWNSTVSGFYYIDNSNVSSTDTANPNGYPALPRKTIPAALAAGSVVHVYGGPYAYGSSGFIELNGTGTSENPIFIIGHSFPRFNQKISVYGAGNFDSHYIIVDSIDTYKFEVIGPADHITFKNSIVRDGGATGLGGSSGLEIDNILFYNNIIFDNGNWLSETDDDVHGTTVGGHTSYLWILDSEYYHNSGDGVQVNAGGLDTQASTNHIYIGRNISHHNKQAGFLTKQSVDCIMSQNKVYWHRPIGSHPSAYGAGLGFQYGPERVWIIYNHVHHCSFGIQTNSTSGLGFGTNSYFVGNLIHDIHHHPAYGYDVFDSWSNAGLTLVGTGNKYVVNNTVYDCDAGINIPGSINLYILNNIISKVTQTNGQHIFIYDTAGLNAVMDGNVIYQPGGSTRFKWGTTSYSLANFKTVSGENVGVDDDPDFIDSDDDDFHLQATSPAIDSSVSNTVYSTFQTLYGLSIDVDFDNVSRSGTFDAGALEYATSDSVISPPTKNLTLTTYAPSIDAPYNSIVGLKQLTIQGFTATIDAPNDSAVNLQHLTVTTFNPIITANYTARINFSPISLAAFAANLIVEENEEEEDNNDEIIEIDFDDLRVTYGDFSLNSEDYYPDSVTLHAPTNTRDSEHISTRWQVRRYSTREIIVSIKTTNNRANKKYANVCCFSSKFLTIDLGTNKEKFEYRVKLQWDDGTESQWSSWKRFTVRSKNRKKPFNKEPEVYTKNSKTIVDNR